MSGPTDLFTSASELLDASVEALDTLPIFDATLEGAPDNAWVSAGAPVIDCCDMLAVHVAEVDEFQLPVATKRAAGKKNEINYVVTVSRCYPTPDDQGNPPSPDAMQDASKQIYADGWALWNHLYNLSAHGDLFSMCDEVVFDFLRPVGPSGGCAGWVLGLHTVLGGYSDVVSS